MAKMRGAIVVDIERCKGCNLCTIACPLHLVTLSATVNHKGYNYAEQTDWENATAVPVVLLCAQTAASLFIVKRRNKDGERTERFGIAERQ